MSVEPSGTSDPLAGEHDVVIGASPPTVVGAA